MTAPSVRDGRFVHGSIWRHVAVMSGTGAIGLIAVFVVDLLNLFYLSRLGHQAIAAAAGFAGAVSFLQLSAGIGMSIGTGALVSRAIGAGRPDDARRLGMAGLFATTVIGCLIGAATLLWIDPLLRLLNATGETGELTRRFIAIVAPSVPLLAGGMCFSGLLRAAGDARGAMLITLVAAFVTAACDPVLIFALDLGLDGAAISTIISRVTMLMIGWWGVARLGMIGRLDLPRLLTDLRVIMAVAFPAILTNLATPVAAAYTTRAMAQFGPAAVAGQATIDRIVPVAFGMIFALSGAVGPIFGQNYGARQMDRVRRCLSDSLLFVILTVAFAWALMAAGQGVLVRAFQLSGDAEAIVRAFCSFFAGGYLFVGALFVANAGFNNLGFPLLSTGFNWGRATLGTIPFVTFGAQWGPVGVLAGVSAGAVLFGTLAMLAAFRVVWRLPPPALPEPVPLAAE